MPRPSRCGALVWSRSGSAVIVAPSGVWLALLPIMFLVLMFTDPFWRYLPWSALVIAAGLVVFNLLAATTIRLTPGRVTIVRFLRRRAFSGDGAFGDSSETSDDWSNDGEQFGRWEQLANNELTYSAGSDRAEIPCLRPAALLRFLNSERARLSGIPAARLSSS